MELDELINTLTEAAVKWGASRDLTKYISTDKVVIKDWVRMKCMFGCEVYGNTLCCPPYVPPPQEMKKFILEYEHALLVGFIGDITFSNPIKHHRKMSKVMGKLEKKAFDLNYPKAFAFTAGMCLYCKTCIIKDLPKNIDPLVARTFCRHRNKARPSMEAAGIDVFSTVENVGFKLETITGKNVDKMKHFGLLLLI